MNKHVDLVYSGYGLSTKIIDSIKMVAFLNKIDTAKLRISQGFDASFVQENTRRYQSETELLSNRLNAVTFALKQAEARVDSIRNIPSLGKRLLSEIEPLYPQISGCSYTETFSYSLQRIPFVAAREFARCFHSRPETLRAADKKKIAEWLKSRLEEAEVLTYFDEVQ